MSDVLYFLGGILLLLVVLAIIGDFIENEGGNAIPALMLAVLVIFGLLALYSGALHDGYRLELVELQP